MSQMPMSSPGMYGGMKPHRGVVVLVLGILGLVLCAVCAPIAWMMGSADLREMDAGRMDPTGRGLTTAGKICGIIGTIILGIGVLMFLLWLVLVIIIGVGAVASGGAHP